MWGKKWFCNQMADLGNVSKGGYNNSFICMVYCNVILLLLPDRVCFTFSWIQAGPCDALDQRNVIKVILCDFWGCSLVMFRFLLCFLGALNCPVTGPGTLLEKTQGGALSYIERGQTPAAQESQGKLLEKSSQLYVPVSWETPGRTIWRTPGEAQSIHETCKIQ